jgi:hypothetical protein
MKERGFFTRQNVRRTELVVLALLLVFLGVMGRFVLGGYPNIETVMVATFLVALLVDKRAAFVFPLIIMTLSDYLMGHEMFALSGMGTIWLFTYSGFALIYLLSRHKGEGIKADLGKLNPRGALNAAGYGIGFALVYDLWTNVGAWLLMYPHTLEGLILCYTMAIPFMLYHMLSGAVTFVSLALPFVSLYSEETKAGAEQPAESTA